MELKDICLVIVLAYTALGWLVLTDIKIINYGRLQNSLANVYFSPKIVWFIFEIPNLLWAFYFIFFLSNEISFAYILFIIHYINRDIIYPLKLKSNTKVPLEILASAFSFTFANGYLQGIANSEAQPRSAFRNILGFIIFVVGMAINIYSDDILQETKLKLKKQEGKNKYAKIDRFLFKYIANPNYLGEIIEWLGYAIVSGHPYSILFIVSTINVLTPAALVRNKWNKQNIENYPKDRKAIVPFLI